MMDNGQLFMLVAKEESLFLHIPKQKKDLKML
jgi:hypothetical protein